MSEEDNKNPSDGGPSASSGDQNGMHEKQTENVPIARLPRTFFSRRWWWATLLVIVLLAVFIRLGIWQLDRRQQRLAANAAYLAQISQSPVSLDDSYLAADPQELVDRSAIAQGHYDHEQQILLTQQSWLGRPGAHLITPLVLEDGQTAVLVDRGWIPSEDAEQDDVSQFNEPGPQVIDGTVQLSQVLSGDRRIEVDGPQRNWYRVEIETIQGQMPYQLLPFYLTQTPPEGVQETLPYRVSVEIDLSEGPHLGYAIQWFLFAMVLAIGYGRFVSTQDGPAKKRQRPTSPDEQGVSP